MQRIPAVLVENLQAPAAYTSTAPFPYVVPANTRTTISSATFNNTTGTARTVSVSIVPSTGAQGPANEIISALSIPITGSQPTAVPGLIGQTLMPGEVLVIKADVGSAVSVRISGYETTL